MQTSVTTETRKEAGPGRGEVDKTPISPVQVKPDRCEDDPEWVREQRFTERKHRETGHL